MLRTPLSSVHTQKQPSLFVKPLTKAGAIFNEAERLGQLMGFLLCLSGICKVLACCSTLRPHPPGNGWQDKYRCKASPVASRRWDQSLRDRASRNGVDVRLPTVLPPLLGGFHRYEPVF